MCALVNFISLGLVDAKKLVNALFEEARSSKPTSVRDLEALIQRGVMASTILQGLNVLRSDVSSLVDVVKGIQYSYREMLEMFKADHDAVIRLVKTVEKLVNKK